MKKLWIDLETRARVDLRNTTAYRYAEDPDFRILMAAWSDDGETVRLAFHDEVDDIPGLWDPTVKKVAHNAAFERICLSRHRGLPVGTYLPIEEFHDTQAIAGIKGYPQGLARLALALGGEKKDEAGTRLINLFCKPNRKGEWNGPDTHPEEWLDFCMYCVQDVATLIDVDRRLRGFPTEIERAIYRADQAVNDAGIRLDVDMARRAVVAAQENQVRDSREFTRLTGVENPNSNPKCLEWFQANTPEDVEVPNLQKDTVSGLLEHDLPADTSRALELRQELALVASKKFSAALDSVSTDGRLRGSFRYFGAHTGRWAGRGVQLHNLPRAQLESEEATDEAILDLMMGYGADSHTLKALVRSVFLGPMTVVDYSAIEARVIAWLAGEEWATRAFRGGRDIYVETAERMSTPGHRLSRSQGKVAVLALGYGGGIPALRHMGAEGTDAELDALKFQWRDANPNIKGMWHSLEAFMRSLQDGNTKWRNYPHGWHRLLTVDEVGTYGRKGHAYRIVLPSGRALHYRDPEWVARIKVASNGADKYTNFELEFTDARGNRARTYGGRLAENVTQAVARDVMAEAIVRLQDKGFTVVGHVHDEVLVEGEHLEPVREIMVQSPEWATGLPIAAEGFVTDRYRKG